MVQNEYTDESGRGAAGPDAVKSDRRQALARWPSFWRRGRSASAPDPEIKALAKKLGITEERVLEEFRRIAFGSLRPFITRTDEGMVLTVPENADDADLAAVA